MRFQSFARPTIALLVAVFLVSAAGTAQARELSGRLHFGKRTQLHLEENEGVVTNLLRSLSLVGGKVPVTNLNTIAIRNAYLFIGEDMTLYYYDRESQSIYAIGDAADLTNIKLRDGVVLKAVENLGSTFDDGESEVALDVQMQTAQEPAEPRVKRARFAFWLETMTMTYDETLMTDLDERNYEALMGALATALPDGDNVDPRAFEHLKLLRDYVENGLYPSGVPLRQLVDRMLKTVKSNVHQPDLEVDASEILPVYEGLAAKLTASSD